MCWKKNPGANAAANVTISEGSDVAKIFVDLITIALENSKVFSSEADLVDGALGLLDHSGMQVADSTGQLRMALSDFAGNAASSPLIVQTAQGLAAVRRPTP